MNTRKLYIVSMQLIFHAHSQRTYTPTSFSDLFLSQTRNSIFLLFSGYLVSFSIKTSRTLCHNWCKWAHHLMYNHAIWKQLKRFFLLIHLLLNLVLCQSSVDSSRTCQIVRLEQLPWLYTQFFWLAPGDWILRQWLYCTFWTTLEQEHPSKPLLVLWPIKNSIN